MKKILLILFIVLGSSFVLSIWSQIMFDNTIEKEDGLIFHLNQAMKYKEVLFYVMIIGASTIPMIVYFSFNEFRWARHIAVSSIIGVFFVFEYLWNVFCCYA